MTLAAQCFIEQLAVAGARNSQCGRYVNVFLRCAISTGYLRGMMAINGKRGAPVGALLVITCIGLAAAGCGSSSTSTSSSSGSKPSTTASVAYASSLEFLNEKVAGPAFAAAEGFKYSGRAGASGDLSTDIASGEISPNVFESVGADNIMPLEPKYTKWYVQYAGTSIVVAYNPKSKYASQFKAIASGKKPLKDLFTLMEMPGFKLGRTDPNIDPQGRDFIYMLELAQSYYHLPSDTVAKILGTSDPGTASSSQIYAESSLDATLQSGQLDASSAFITQAIELHLDYIPLPSAINLGDMALAAQYAKATVTITSNGAKTTKSGSPQVIDITIVGKPTPAGIAFVKYTLSSAGLAQYKKGGFTLLPLAVTGDSSAIPAAIKSELGS
jgi:molybdate/tungstate transport system substrate-binding protein